MRSVNASRHLDFRISCVIDTCNNLYRSRMRRIDASSHLQVRRLRVIDARRNLQPIKRIGSHVDYTDLRSRRFILRDVHHGADLGAIQ